MSRASRALNGRGREEAIERARKHSPFLREALAARSEIGEIFLQSGTAEAVATALASGADLPLESRLRRRRHGLALAVALGDLSGELPLERVTGFLSDFADQAIDEAVTAALAERVPDATPAGFAVIAMGKLGSRELNYSSDVDLLLLFILRRCRVVRAKMLAKRPSGSAGGSSSCCRSGLRTAMSSASTCGSGPPPR